MSRAAETRSAFLREDESRVMIRDLTRLLAAVVIEHGGDDLALSVSSESIAEVPSNPVLYRLETDFLDMVIRLRPE